MDIKKIVVPMLVSVAMAFIQSPAEAMKRENDQPELDQDRQTKKRRGEEKGREVKQQEEKEREEKQEFVEEGSDQLKRMVDEKKEEKASGLIGRGVKNIRKALTKFFSKGSKRKGGQPQNRKTKKHRGEEKKEIVEAPKQLIGLPDDLLIEILSHFESTELFVDMRQVCRKFERLALQAVSCLDWKQRGIPFEKVTLEKFPLLKGLSFIDWQRMPNFEARCDDKVLMGLTMLELRGMRETSQGCEITEDDVNSIGRMCPNLQRLNFWHVRITDQSAERICTIFSRLKKLKIEMCHELKSPAFKSELLEELDLNSTQITNETAKNIFEAGQRLERLSFWGCKAIENPAIQDGLLLSKLKKLNLGQTQVNDEFVNKICVACPELQNLALGYTQATDESASKICVACLKLEKFNLSGCQLKNPVIESKSLKELYLNDTQITDEAVSKICVACPRLEKLQLRGCKALRSPKFKSESLRVLDLSCTQIVDEAVTSLFEACTGLQELSLSDCSEIKAPVIKSTSLKKLCLTMTQVTESAVGKICEECPRLENLNLWSCYQVSQKYITALRKKYQNRIKILAYSD